LLESGADLNKVNKIGETALLKAAAAGQRPSVELLIHAGSNVHAKDCNGGGLLHCAVAGGDPQLIEWLGNETNIDIDSEDSNGWSPLMLAVKHGSLGVTAALLDIGADPDLTNFHGITPMTLAKRTGNRALLALLRRFKAATSGTQTATTGSVAGEEADAAVLAWDETLGLLSAFYSTSDDETMAERAEESLRKLFKMLSGGKGEVERQVMLEFATEAEAVAIDHLSEGKVVDEELFGVILMAIASN